MRRSPRTRRMRATTSCYVGPTGLSMMIRPSIDRTRDAVHQRSAQFDDIASHGAAGGVLVAATGPRLRGGADVDLAFRTQADAVLVAFRLLEEDHRLQLLDRQRLVDDAFGVVVRRARRVR